VIRTTCDLRSRADWDKRSATNSSPSVLNQKFVAF
jgi:hypothetical protein